MKKRKISVFGILVLSFFLFMGCFGSGNDQTGETAAEYASEEVVLPDGIYTAEFDTDNSMFHVNETDDGKGTLKVENGKMTIHVSLGSKNIVNLYPGFAEDAQKENAELLYPTVDTVTYKDGWVDEVYGFDIPVPAIDEEFDVALVGTKGKWYDHKVIVSNPAPMQDEIAQDFQVEALKDGSYTVQLTFEGGSGKAEILSPATVVVSGKDAVATIQWSSPNYDYMIVSGEKYLPINTEGNSIFEIPIPCFDEPIDVIGDTVAMSTPHEIAYTITFYSDTLQIEE